MKSSNENVKGSAPSLGRTSHSPNIPSKHVVEPRQKQGNRGGWESECGIRQVARKLPHPKLRARFAEVGGISAYSPRLPAPHAELLGPAVALPAEDDTIS